MEKGCVFLKQCWRYTYHLRTKNHLPAKLVWMLKVWSEIWVSYIGSHFYLGQAQTSGIRARFPRFYDDLAPPPDPKSKIKGIYWGFVFWALQNLKNKRAKQSWSHYLCFLPVCRSSIIVKNSEKLQYEGSFPNGAFFADQCSTMPRRVK